jgi:hypothetical protein
MKNRNKDKESTKKVGPGLVIVVALAILMVVSVPVTISLLMKKSPPKDDQPTTSQVRVCGSDVVEQYNKIMSAPPDSEDASEERFDKLASDVSSKEHVEKDSTCQYILLNYAIAKLDAEGIEKHSQTIKNLHGEGVFPDNALYYIMPMQGINNYLENPSGETQNNDDHGEAGVY